MQTLTWVSATGVAFDLSEANGVDLVVGTAGLDAPPRSLITASRAPHGAALVNSRYEPREVILEANIFDSSASRDASGIIDDMAGRFQGPGVLRSTKNGVTRELRSVYYSSGLAGAEREVPFWQPVTVSLLALDPFWYGAAQSSSLPFGAPTGWSPALSWSPSIPWNGGSSIGVSVSGDLEAFPVIEVIGPFTDLTIGLGTVEAWQTTFGVPAGHRLMVDSRPSYKGVRWDGAAVNTWTALTEASRLWTLPTGSSSVVIGSSGSTGASLISLTWEPRYLTP